MRASIVVITRDRADVLGRCLDSIQRELSEADELILVDSSSSDLTEALIARDYARVKLIRIPAKQGSMPGQRNIGIRQARGEIVVFTDDDCVVHENWLSELLCPYADKEIGGVGGRQILPNQEDGAARQTRIGGWLDEREFQVVGNFGGAAEGLAETEWLVGCNMSFRHQALLEAGGFDERLAGDFSWEEIDVCRRIREKRRRLVYNARAVVDHNIAPRPRVERGSNQVAFYWKVNRTYFFLKYFGPGKILRRMFLQEPYWAWRTAGVRKTLLYDVRPKLLGCLAFARFAAARRKYPLRGLKPAGKGSG